MSSKTLYSPGSQLQNECTTSTERISTSFFFLPLKITCDIGNRIKTTFFGSQTIFSKACVCDPRGLLLNKFINWSVFLFQHSAPLFTKHLLTSLNGLGVLDLNSRLTVGVLKTKFKKVSLEFQGELPTGCNDYLLLKFFQLINVILSKFLKISYFAELC